MNKDYENPKVTLAGIEERRVEIHSYETFARAIAEQVLLRSEEIVRKDGEKEVVELDARIEVKPVTRTVSTPQGFIVVVVCLQICVYIFGIPICMHIQKQWPSVAAPEAILSSPS